MDDPLSLLRLCRGRLGRLANFDGQLRNAPGDGRLRLRADGLDHRRAEVDADVGRLVGREDARLRAFNAAFGDFLAVTNRMATIATP